jgi:hypothetical protein
MWRLNVLQQILLLYLQNTRRLYKWKASDNLKHHNDEDSARTHTHTQYTIFVCACVLYIQSEAFLEMKIETDNNLNMNGFLFYISAQNSVRDLA